jgi:hypothetical protein
VFWDEDHEVFFYISLRASFKNIVSGTCEVAVKEQEQEQEQEQGGLRNCSYQKQEGTEKEEAWRFVICRM